MGGGPSLVTNVRRDFLDEVDHMLKSGVNPNVNADRWTLMRTVIPLHLAAQQNNVSMIKLLLRHKASVNIKDRCGTIPLHITAKKGHLAAMNLLLSEGAIVNAKTRYGNTPLHLSCLWRRVKCLKILFLNGADVNIKNAFGMTPKALCVSSKKMVDELRKFWEFSIAESSLDLSSRGFEDRLEGSTATTRRMSEPNKKREEATAAINHHIPGLTDEEELATALKNSSLNISVEHLQMEIKSIQSAKYHIKGLTEEEELALALVSSNPATVDNGTTARSEQAEEQNEAASISRELSRSCPNLEAAFERVDSVDEEIIDLSTYRMLELMEKEELSLALAISNSACTTTLGAMQVHDEITLSSTLFHVTGLTEEEELNVAINRSCPNIRYTAIRRSHEESTYIPQISRYPSRAKLKIILEYATQAKSKSNGKSAEKKKKRTRK